MPPMRQSPDGIPVLPPDFVEDAKFIAAQQALERNARGYVDIEIRTKRVLACILKLDAWRASGVPMSAYVDTRGLKLDLGLEGKGDGAGIHTHVPFRYLADEHLEALAHASVMSERDASELRRATYVERGDAVRAGAESLRQERDLLEYIEDNEHPESSYDDTREDKDIRNALLAKIICYPDVAARGLWYSRSIRSDSCARLTNDAIVTLLRARMNPDAQWVWQRQTVATRIHALIVIAEELNKSRKERDYLSVPGSWNAKSMRKSYRAARNTSAIFDHRAMHLRLGQNYDSANIVSAIFETFSQADLVAAGIRVVRGNFREGTQFIGFWDDRRFRRVYLDPQIHLSDVARERVMGTLAEDPQDPKTKRVIGGVEHLARNDFERLEGLLVPYWNFKEISESFLHFSRDHDSWEARGLNMWPLYKRQFLEECEGMLAVAETELSVEDFTELYRLIRNFRKELRADRVPPQEVVAALRASVERISSAYRDQFEGKTAHEVLEQRIGEITSVEHRLGGEFLETLVRELGEAHASKCDPRVAQLDYTGTIVQVPEKGLSLAQEEEAIREMKLKRGPVISVFGGARDLPTEGETASQAQRMTDIIHAVSIRLGAHTMVPETATGFGALFGIANAAFVAGRTPAQIASGPQTFGVGPGRDLYTPKSTIVDRSPQSKAWAASAMNIIATTYHAGWSKPGATSEQIRHNYYRQALTRRISVEPPKEKGGEWKEHPRVAVVGNGGKWTIREVLTAVEDDTRILFVKETGRFALLMATLLEKKDEWGTLVHDDTQLLDYIGQVIESIDPPSEREILKNGSNFGDPDYRSELCELLQQEKTNLMKISSINSLEGDLIYAMQD